MSDKRPQVGTVELATIVPKEDPVWTEPETQVLLCQASNQTEEQSVEKAITIWNTVDT